MRANADKGRPHGRLPYGYRRVYDEATRELVRQEPDPEQAEIVQEAARRFLAGESTRSIANDFNERGLPPPHSGRGWDLTRIRRLLTNPTLNGKRVHQGEVVHDGSWDDDPRRRDLRQARHALRRSGTTYDEAGSGEARLLTGVVRCGVCAGPAVHTKQGGFGNRKLRHVYTCRYNNCTVRDASSLERYVTGWVLDRLGRPDTLALLSTGDNTTAHAAAGRRSPS